MPACRIITDITKQGYEPNVPTKKAKARPHPWFLEAQPNRLGSPRYSKAPPKG